MEASVCWDWLRKATLDALSLAVFPLEINVPGYGDKLGVEQWLLLRSHWSNNRNSSSAVGPPFGMGSTKQTIDIISKIKWIHRSEVAQVMQVYSRKPLLAKSKAVVRSHIWIVPLQCPVNMNRRGRDPMRLEPSHSCTQKHVIIVQSTARIIQTLKSDKQV